MSSARLRTVLIAAVTLAGAAGAAALYGIGGAGGNSAAACSAARATAKTLQPLATGAVAAFDVAEQPTLVPNLDFNGPDGARLDLAAFRGRTVLVNLWATWCAPCKEEMPALDALQGALGSPAFEVVAINIDTRNLERPRAWLADAGIARLAYYADPQAKVFQQLRAVDRARGMPTTLLIDGEGCELGTLHGPADWASADAKALVKAALDRR